MSNHFDMCQRKGTNSTIEISQYEDLSKSVAAYYDQNAQQYSDKTANADLSRIYSQFLQYIPPGGRILDAGCGPGRDLKFFSDSGYGVVGIDNSSAMVEIATKFAAVPCYWMRMEDIEYHTTFEGVWCCAALLHVPKTNVPHTLRRFWSALKPNGALYIAVKKGTGEEFLADGRFFAAYEMDEFATIIRDAALFELVESWETADASIARDTVRWLNFIALKRAD
jgi:2-polyprenyl-3-methyl-5-hydroxy-6-metoxy-1,4-benzoquinol methylase